MRQKRDFPIPEKRLKFMNLQWMNRGLHYYWRFSRGLSVDVESLAYDDDGGVFLRYDRAVSRWGLPRTSIEAGETAAAAARRALSQVGLAAGPEYFLTLHAIHEAAADRSDHVVLYKLRVPSLPTEGDENGRRFPVTALPHEMEYATRSRIEEAMKPIAEANA